MSPQPRALRTPRTTPLQVLIPIYPDFNTFDANGPIEVLSQANRNSSGPHHFQIHIAAAAELTTSIELVRIARDISLAEAIGRVTEWDILLVPGGAEKAVLGIVETWQRGKKEDGGNEIMELIERFMRDREGFTFTVCTASLFLGALGRLAGRRATTHWRSLATLQRLCAGFGDVDSRSDIVRARWVDSGDDAKEEGLPRLLTAGGVSCGLDATFHLLDLTVGLELAEKVAGILDYQRRRDELQMHYVIPG